MFGLLSRKESKSILKTASDDADTLSLAHESNISIGLPDGESVATSKLDDRQFDFDFEIINTATYRKVFNMARSKIPPKNGSRAYSPPQASTSGSANAPETVELPSINAHAAIHPVVASKESEPFSSRPNASSRDIRSHSILPKDSVEAAGEHDADSENQPESTSKKSEFRIGEYDVGTTIESRGGCEVKRAWSKDHRQQFAIKFIRREPGASDTNHSQEDWHVLMILKGLSHPNIIRLHDIFETESHFAVVLKYMPDVSLAKYVVVQTLSEHVSRKLFAQIISAVGYLHRKGIVNPRLLCSQVHLDSNRNVLLTGFSTVTIFHIQDGPRFKTGNSVVELYCSVPEESPRFYEARQADVWSCGVILVSAQYGLILDINNVKYFMMAGSLPFGDVVNTTGYDAQLQLNYVSSEAMKFPDYFPMRVRRLVERMLAKDFTERAELPEVAEHIRLSDYAYADIMSDIIDNPISGPRYSEGCLSLAFQF